MDNYDYIVVGGGLAGCCLAWELHFQNKNVAVIADAENNSTLVAAGLFNPITGKMLSKTWQAEKLFATLHEFYRKIEEQTGSDFFIELPIYRPFISIEEQNNWMALSENPGLQNFIEKVFIRPSGFEAVLDPFGGIVVKQAGFIRTDIFVEATKEYFKKKGKWKTEKVNYNDFIFSETKEQVAYRHSSAEKIIFCEGVSSLQNPWFSWVPVRPLKGETLTVETTLSKEIILNRGVYAVPQMATDAFKIGATYDHQMENQGITEKAKNELLQKWEMIHNKPTKVLSQQWGIRPTSPDRKPILGLHPEFKTIGILNGLGTKGVSLAPFAAKVLVEFLNGKQPDQTYQTLSLNRYYSLYWKSVNKA